MGSVEYNLRRAIEGRPVLDKRRRPGDRHKNPHRKRGGKNLSKWERRKIIAWDGEGANIWDETIGSMKHVYNLLSNSEGACIMDPNGLGTEQVFEFFLANNNPLAINVIFGGSYDINMILGDLDKEAVKALWMNGWVNWRSYKISYSHRKRFSLKKRVGSNGREPKWSKTFMLWDVLGFFQTNFVDAFRAWIGYTDIIDRIEEMKLQRSEFSADRIEEIIDYNKMENKLLVILMERMLAALDEAKISLTRYDGAGAIAGALLKKYDVRTHKGSFPKEMSYPVQVAYGGGRIEAVKIGNYEGPVYHYDINSAYPSEARSLPSLRGATFKHIGDGIFDIKSELTTPYDPHSLYHVAWVYRTGWGRSGSKARKRFNASFFPLWMRDIDGSIYYPPFGEGIFWGSEVQNLVKWWQPQDYRIVEAWELQLDNDYKPFKFIDEVYAQRKEFKARRSMASEVLKLGMNSIYGKLAQQAGYRYGRIPTYHQLMWAGMITASTRAKVYDAAMQKPDAIVSFMTDGILSLEPLDLPLGDGLGEWNEEVFDGVTIVQPGVYWLKHSDDGEWYAKYRGFDKGSLERKILLERWATGEPMVAKVTRFVGMGGALNGDFENTWRRWITSERELAIWPDGKRRTGLGQPNNFAEALCPTEAKIPVFARMSMPYPLLWEQDMYQAKMPLEEGVPIRIFDEEVMDSYA